MVSLESLEKDVDELYKFRDHYFEIYPIEEAAAKTENLKQKLNEALEHFSQIEDESQKKASFLLLKGRALNVMPSYDQQVEEHLSRAVKLDPKLSDAWIHLGESYWKKGDVKSAHNCFTGSISHSRNKVALRSLSMVTRQLSSNEAERIKLIEDSVPLAKEAVQLDISDGTSWLVLGNAYLSLFFVKVQDPEILKQCFSAYRQAERDIVAKMNPDLHYNRATLYQYEEDYDRALAGYSLASSLDPTFEEANIKEDSLLKYLRNFSNLIATKGKLSHKKLQSMADSLNSSTSSLGPYASGGSYKLPSGTSVSLSQVTLGELSPGVNAGKIVVGKVVCSFNVEKAASFSFCIIDKDKTCVGVTVYNIAPEWGVKIGDSVAIPQPVYQHLDFRYKEELFQFSSIRVQNPTSLVLNGRRLTSSSRAPPALSLLTKSE